MMDVYDVDVNKRKTNFRNVDNIEIDSTYNAMARARSSESVHVSDIHVMFSGWENVPKICVQTTPK